jgi:hypothetical protein
MPRPILVTMNIVLRPLYHTTLVVEFHTLQTVCLESDLKLYIFALGGKYLYGISNLVHLATTRSRGMINRSALVAPTPLIFALPLLVRFAIFLAFSESSVGEHIVTNRPLAISKFVKFFECNAIALHGSMA